MTLKDQMAGDLGDGVVWFNGGDFAEYHEVNGKRVLCELGAMRSRPEKIGRTPRGKAMGVWSGSSCLFIRTSEFNRAPRPDEKITIDGVIYDVISVMDDLGVYVIEYGRHDDAKLRRPNA